MKTKTFDCVGMKRMAQTRIRAQVSGMSAEEEIAFFRDGAEDFERRIQAAREDFARAHEETPMSRTSQEKVSE